MTHLQSACGPWPCLLELQLLLLGSHWLPRAGRSAACQTWTWGLSCCFVSHAAAQKHPCQQLSGSAAAAACILLPRLLLQICELRTAAVPQQGFSER